jgi:hypothetical protein
VCQEGQRTPLMQIFDKNLSFPGFLKNPKNDHGT